MTSLIYGLPAHEITRDFFFNVGDWFGITKWGILVLFAAAFVIGTLLLVWKMLIWSQGKSAPLPKIKDSRFFAVAKGILIPKDFLKEWYPGLIHLSMLYGCAGIIITTVLVAVQEYITFLFFGHRFLTGHVYLLWSLASDLSSLLVLSGVALSFFRRKVLRPTRLDTKPSDIFALGLFTAVMISGLLANALRIAICGYPDFEIWSPISFLFSLPFWLFPVSFLTPLHFVIWWTHILGACLLIALAGGYKPGQFAAAVLNIYCSPVSGKDGADRYRAALITEKDAAAGRKGTGCIDDFTWKQTMDLDACIRCGRCQDRCPSYLSGLPLSPKKFIQDLKRCLDDHTVIANGEPMSGEVKDYVTGDELWSCTGCAACMEACPSKVDHVQKFIDTRRSFASRGDVPEGLSAHWKNIAEKKNQYGGDNAERGTWMSAKSVVPTLEEKRDVEYLFFAGCAAVYDPEARKAANAFLQLMKKADVSIGVLGTEEVCCGDSALRTGNEEIFRECAIANLRSFTRYGVKKIITACPHGYNVLRKEYRELAAQLCDSTVRADYDVMHHTQLIAQLIAEDRIPLRTSPSPYVMFSDPCFLGRYNNVYDAPRNALRAVPGLMLVEAAHSRAGARCCGGPLAAGKGPANKLAEFRARDVHMSGARTAVTGCPHCTTMIRSGLRDLGVENIRTLDIAEFILEASGD